MNKYLTRKVNTNILMFLSLVLAGSLYSAEDSDSEAPPAPSAPQFVFSATRTAGPETLAAAVAAAVAFAATGFFACNICGKNFHHTRTAVFKKHMLVHTGERPFSCHICNKNFTQKGNFNAHMRIHTDEKTLTCFHCDQSFRSYSSRAYHFRKCHGAIVQPVEALTLHVPKITEPVATAAYSAEGSDSEAPHSTTLTPSAPQFVFSDTRTAGPETLATVASDPQAIFKASTTTPAPEPAVATAAYNAEDSDSEAPHPTPSAPQFVFNDTQTTALDLLATVALDQQAIFKASTTHAPEPVVTAAAATFTETRPHACDKCGKRFLAKQWLTEHVCPHTTGERLFACTVSGCSKLFSNKFNLARHNLTHTGKKSFVCSHCDRKFTASNNLKKHLRKCRGANVQPVEVLETHVPNPTEAVPAQEATFLPTLETLLSRFC